MKVVRFVVTYCRKLLNAYGGVCFSGIMFIPNLVKVGQRIKS